MPSVRATWCRGVAGLTALCVVVGCASDARPPPSALEVSKTLLPEQADASAGERDCAVYGGCSCDDEGERIACGSVKEKVAGYTWCSVGEQVCESGKWSACRSDRVVLRKSVGSLRLAALGASESCVNENPCSPQCNVFEDDGNDLALDAGSGLLESDGGLTLAETPNMPGTGLCERIVVSPAASALRLTSLELSNPETVSFTAEVQPVGCVDTPPEPLWSVDRPDIAEISETGVVTLRQPIAGPIVVTAFAGNLSGSASLEVTVDVHDVSQAPPGTQSWFDGGASAPDAVTLLYPYADTVFPLGQKPPKVQWDSLAAVEASWWGACGLRSDGSVRCWGTNSSGSIKDQAGPYVALSSRYQHYCALTAAGGVECWGDNSALQATNQPPTFTAVSAGAFHTCGLRVDGSVECWGQNDYGQSQSQPGPFTQISAGQYHTCGVLVNGDAQCWGNNAAGQAGLRSGPFISVRAGSNHVCALRRDRRVECWGGGTYGESTVPAVGAPYAALDVGSYHNCALRTDGSAQCWGRNNYGQATDHVGPFVSVSAAAYHSCGLLTTGAIECWGQADGGKTIGLPGGAVRVGLRYPAAGTPIFEWSTVVAESRGDFVDAPDNTRPIAPKPRFQIPELVWDALQGTAAGKEVMLTLQRHTGDRLLEPVERRLKFSDAPLSGKIVYQSYGTRQVVNTLGTYEQPDELWGAAELALDPVSHTSSVVAGFTGDPAASGSDNGCRGCHSVATSGHALVTGFDGQRDALLLDIADTNPNPDTSLETPANEYGGFLWSAVHPTGELAFTSRGPTPCTTRIDGTTGTCDTAQFEAPAGELEGTDIALATTPGGMGGAGWTDTDGDTVFDSASNNALFSLTTPAGMLIPSSGLPSGLRAAMPAFSPEGDRVVFTHYAGSFTDGTGAVHAGDKRSLGMVDFDVASGAFSNLQRLTNVPGDACDPALHPTDPCTDVWPSFLPEGAGVVFEREVFNNSRVVGSTHADFGGTRSGCERANDPSCDQGSQGQLWWVPLDSDGEPSGDFPLTQANGEISSAHLVPNSSGHGAAVESRLNYQPSLSPTRNGKHDWVVFTSRRAYGNIATVNPWWSDPRAHAIGDAVTPKKLWVAALDRAVTSGDPSAPAFYLEGQDTQGANGRPVWVKNECVPASESRSTASECRTDVDCCGAPDSARCSLQLPLAEPAVRHCVPFEASACIDDHSEVVCTSDDECCKAAEGARCASGRCQLPPGLGVYQATAFERDFVAQCPYGTEPVWQFLEWQAKMPAGTSIDFYATTGATPEELNSNAAVELGTALPPDTTAWTSWGRDVEDSIHYKLEDAGYGSQQRLRITMLLNPDPSAVLAPVLTQWRVVYDCQDAL